jgi:hypothetical protein
MTKSQIIKWIGKKNWKSFVKWYGINYTKDYKMDKVLKFLWGNYD